MSTYPAITAAIADQRRHDLIAQADAYRLGRLARQGRTARPSRPGRPVLTARRVVTAAAAAGCAAAAVFLLGPAAAAHASAHHFVSPTVSADRWAAPAAHPRAYRLVRWAAPAPAHHFVSPDVHFRGHVYSHLGRGHVF